MILKIFMLLYRLAWIVFLPLILLYLRKRGRKDSLYIQDMGERFGRYSKPLPQDAIWVHAVSMGEMRSALGLIKLMLARGDKVVVTNFTPAGRREALRQFGDAIERGQLAVVWVPLEIGFAMRRFFKACRPKIGLTLEVEVWPVMIAEARRAGVPLYMCNGQYGSRPLARDSGGLRLRQRVMRGLTGAFVKSNLQASRFAKVGVTNVTVTGELRFDQYIPPAQVAAAKQILPQLPARKIVTIASGTEGEEAVYLELFKSFQGRKDAPLFIYVPRAPERFTQVTQDLKAAQIPVLRRSEILSPDLTTLAQPIADDTMVIMGDTMGEMYFYLSLCDKAVVGGGFTPHGAHNIIEPLALGKAAITGPETWTIEYPFVEAQAAGLVQSVPDVAGLIKALEAPQPADFETKIAAFWQEHGGASQKTLAAIDRVIAAK